MGGMGSGTQRWAVWKADHRGGSPSRWSIRTGRENGPGLCVAGPEDAAEITDDISTERGILSPLLSPGSQTRDSVKDHVRREAEGQTQPATTAADLYLPVSSPANLAACCRANKGDAQFSLCSTSGVTGSSKLVVHTL